LQQLRYLSAALLIALCTCVFGQAPPQSHELADVRLTELGRLKSTDIQVYGVQIGTQMSQVNQLVGRFGPLIASVYFDSLGVFGSSDGHSTETYSGVEMSVKDDSVISIYVHPKTGMSQTAEPQTLYVEQISTDLRLLFESYTDELRLTNLGSAVREMNTDNSTFREYSYDYPTRGMLLKIYAWRKGGTWREELAMFKLYPPKLP